MASELEKTLFNMKLTAKSLARESAKADKNQKEYDKKALASVGKSAEKAKMFAAEAVRNKNISLQFTRLALRVEAVSSRV
jgi:charged multivesicular body protein 1